MVVDGVSVELEIVSLACLHVSLTGVWTSYYCHLPQDILHIIAGQILNAHAFPTPMTLPLPLPGGFRWS